MGGWEMPSKPKSPWSGYEIPHVSPGDPNQNSIRELVKHALVDLDELAHLDDSQREGLEGDLVDAVGHFRAGLSAGKRGVSDEFLATAIFHNDVNRALETAGVPTTKWSRIHREDGYESVIDRVARAVGEVCSIDLPKDTKRIVRAAASIDALL